MMVAMPVVLYVMAPGFARIPGQMERTTELARIAFPYLLFVSLTSLQSGMLNALGRFAVPAAAPALANVTIIIALLVGVGAGGDRALFLSWGIFATGIVQFLWLLADCRRIGVGFRLVRPRLTPDVKRLLTRILPVAFGAGIYQVNLLVNRTIASLVGVGAVSWIYFADRVNLLPVGIFGYAVGVALLAAADASDSVGQRGHGACQSEPRHRDQSCCSRCRRLSASACWPNRSPQPSLSTAGLPPWIASLSRTPCSRFPLDCRRTFLTRH